MNQSSQGTKAPKAHDAVPVFCEHPLKILNAKTIKFWYSERQLVSVPKGQCMDRLSKENKRNACPMDSKPKYANKCLITSLSARLVLNLLSRIHYTTQSATLCKQNWRSVWTVYISKGGPLHKDLTRGGFQSITSLRFLGGY